MESLLERKNFEKAMLERQLNSRPGPELASYMQGYTLGRSTSMEPQED